MANGTDAGARDLKLLQNSRLINCSVEIGI